MDWAENLIAPVNPEPASSAPRRGVDVEPGGAVPDGIGCLDAELGEIFSRMAAAAEGSAERARLRADVIQRALPLVNRLASRFRGRGEQFDDLAQAAALALVKAADNYDPARRVPFTGYLVPCVIGALKRHFRDKGWDVRVPRPLQECHLAIESATIELTQRLRRTPTPAELAAEVDMSRDEVVAGLAARQAYDTASLNEPVGADAGGAERQDLLGGPDLDLEEVADRVSLGPLLQRLPQRERIVVTRRFFGNLTQAEIAAELGISQMHVSRILERVLSWLRGALLGDDPDRYPGAEADHSPDVQVYPAGPTVLVTLHGAIEANCADHLRTALVKAVTANRPRRFIVDLHGVPSMTTAGAAAFVATMSACGHVGARLHLVRVTAPVARVLERTGVSWILTGRTRRPTRPLAVPCAAQPPATRSDRDAGHVGSIARSGSRCDSPRSAQRRPSPVARAHHPVNQLPPGVPPAEGRARSTRIRTPAVRSCRIATRTEPTHSGPDRVVPVPPGRAGVVAVRGEGRLPVGTAHPRSRRTSARAGACPRRGPPARGRSGSTPAVARSAGYRHRNQQRERAPPHREKPYHDRRFTPLPRR